MPFKSSEGDHGDVRYRGGGTRPTTTDQFSELISTPTPGSSFQVQPEEPTGNECIDYTGRTLSNVERHSDSCLGSTQSMQVHASGDLIINAFSILRPNYVRQEALPARTTPAHLAHLSHLMLQGNLSDNSVFPLIQDQSMIRARCRRVAFAR